MHFDLHGFVQFIPKPNHGVIANLCVCKQLFHRFVLLKQLAQIKLFSNTLLSQLFSTQFVFAEFKCVKNASEEGRTREGAAFAGSFGYQLEGNFQL